MRLFIALLISAASGGSALLAVGTRPVTINAGKYDTLQAAFDAVPTTGGIVLIPPGDYEIVTPLIVRTAETRIVGSGAATHIINKNQFHQPAMKLAPEGIEKDPKLRIWRVQVADVRISGNESSGDGIYAEGVQEIYLEGVSIDHNGHHGIHLVNCYEDPRIADCIITYNKQSGIEINGCHDIVVNSSHFEENLDALHCFDTFNLCMNGNNIDDHLRHGVVIENTYGSVVSGNMIEECNGTAIILDRDCYGITLSANVIAHHLEGGIDLRDAHGCAVSANTFTITHKFGVRAAKDSARNTISANNFCNTHIGEGKDKRPATAATPMGTDAGAGVLLEGARDMNITGNSFSGLSTAAIWSTATCQRLLITGNSCTDCGRKLPSGSKWIDVDAGTGSIITTNLDTP